ncbi:universal stress protein [Sporosarcina sp. BI001-red]|uniref:universal stress protein n=1 Tax=Sporosarcina sp. BI001-red TaxID=2282866 RepID=UPI000E260C00|nr:universal stress protein [Sporosarcina sp. BI001-red]REB05516.1 universal stress protein [Sporosarcina sp. BI001-red]
MNIAVAVDGSESALRATRHALMLVQHLPETQLEIIFVTDFNKVEDERLLTQSPKNLAAYQKKNVQPVVKLAREVGVEPKVTLLKGHTGPTIIKYVNSSEVDQLIIGSRGLNAFKGLIFGSVSEKVVKRMSCPVTLVK